MTKEQELINQVLQVKKNCELNTFTLNSQPQSFMTNIKLHEFATNFDLQFVEQELGKNDIKVEFEIPDYNDVELTFTWNGNND
ncbi:hypothetical protein COE51_01535 [Bacillus pseudomycoides]|nr:hypothetical protein COE51_01535 [Bacillus pseudomycoides]